MSIVSLKERDGGKVLAIATGMTARVLAQSKLSLELSDRGFIFGSDGSMREWQGEGTFCEETGGRDSVFIYGKAFGGISLVDAVEGERAVAWKAFHTAIAAISRAFVEKKILDADLTAIAAAGPGSILVADDGTVLVLPSTLYLRCVSSHGESTELENRLLWVHPDCRTLNPTWAFSFMAGTVAYRIASGVAPFGRIPHAGRNMRKQEAVALDMRNGFFEPIDVALWAIRPAAAACINALVSTKTATSTDTLVSFGPSIDSIIDSARESIPESEEFAAAREEKAKAIRARARKEDFFRRYRGTFKVAGIVLAVAGILVGTYINDMKAKPSTLHLTPQAVVEQYYNAIATLDQEIPKGFTAKGVKTVYDETVTNLYVTSKVRTNFEGAGIMTPAELYAGKDPGKDMIYGMTRFRLDSLAVLKEQATCTVSFWYWIPMTDPSVAEKPQTEAATADTATLPIQISVYECSDRVTLTWYKDRWKISSIDVARRNLAESDGAGLVQAIKAGTATDRPFAPAESEIEEAQAVLDGSNQRQTN